jgi:hypothetical protein
MSAILKPVATNIDQNQAEPREFSLLSQTCDLALVRSDNDER